MRMGSFDIKEGLGIVVHVITVWSDELGSQALEPNGLFESLQIRLQFGRKLKLRFRTFCNLFGPASFEPSK
jgi:hypothetical protein